MDDSSPHNLLSQLWRHFSIRPPNLVSPTSCLHTTVHSNMHSDHKALLLQNTQQFLVAILLCPKSSHRVFKFSLLPDVSPTISCFGNSSPCRPFFSLSSPTLQIPYLFLPCCLCHVITSISWGFSLEPPLPPKICGPHQCFPSLEYHCLAILHVRKKGDFWLITTSFGTSKPRRREEPSQESNTSLLACWTCWRNGISLGLIFEKQVR